MDEELLTTEDVMEWLKVSKATIERWRKAGMPCIQRGRFIRFEREKVKQWLETKKN